MIKSTRNQQHYTESILHAAGRSNAEYTKCIKIWWWNYTNSTNLRLSKTGFQFIQKFTQISLYECTLPEPLRNRTLIQLSRLMTCPYYIHKIDQIYVLGEEEYVMLKLHADNLQQYLNNLQL